MCLDAGGEKGSFRRALEKVVDRPEEAGSPVQSRDTWRCEGRAGGSRSCLPSTHCVWTSRLEDASRVGNIAYTLLTGSMLHSGRTADG